MSEKQNRVATSEGRLSVTIHRETGGTLWAEVAEMPGCFASGDNLATLFTTLAEAMEMWDGTDPPQKTAWRQRVDERMAFVGDVADRLSALARRMR